MSGPQQPDTLGNVSLGLGVASLEGELGRPVDFSAVEDALVWAVRSDLDDTADDLPPPPPRAKEASTRRGSNG